MEGGRVWSSFVHQSCFMTLSRILVHGGHGYLGSASESWMELPQKDSAWIWKVLLISDPGKSPRGLQVEKLLADSKRPGLSASASVQDIPPYFLVQRLYNIGTLLWNELINIYFCHPSIWSYIYTIIPLVALDENKTLTDAKPDLKGPAKWLVVWWSLRTRLDVLAPKSPNLSLMMCHEDLW